MNTYILTVNGAVACEIRRDMIRRWINASYVFLPDDQRRRYENDAWYQVDGSDNWAIRIESLPRIIESNIKTTESCYPGSILSVKKVKRVKTKTEL